MEKGDINSSKVDGIQPNLKKEKCKRSQGEKTQQKTKYTINKLTKELVYKPHILKFILYLQKCLRRRKRSLKSLKLKYKNMISFNITSSDASTQTESTSANEIDVNLSWKVSDNVENSVSLADQVKEAAENALQQTGMVYEETSGMYYDYNTGYYYNAATGLYYHNSTGCYYYYDKDQNTYTFHSQADVSDFPNQQDEANYNLSKKSKSKKAKKVGLCESFEDISNSIAAMSLHGCRNALESIAPHHPPCIRIIVSESSVGTLKVGSLFILTKEGGTLGREGTSHAILIPEENVSRHHLTFSYDEDLSSYYIKDVGSRNGTILNGVRISETKTESDLVKIVHGSTLQLGSTKLLCHIHKGNDTCGHCEPGLLIKETVAAPKIYKTMNIKALHKQELRRLREKYKVNPGKPDGTDEKLMPEGYEDKARLRREKVGSSHHGAKTEQASLDTTIASTNKGFKLLQKMGWSVGDGLGKTAQGNTDPVKLLSNVGTSGLGAVNLETLSNLSQSGVSNSRRQGIWLAAQKRYDKATTSSFFNLDESDDENPDDKKSVFEDPNPGDFHGIDAVFEFSIRS
ncbi:uncharacterized protein LOC143917461 isoform X2 [Arctopsyche grandis]|uniref:uncharacterized protein LOC143917461 isoform X2 n=1 Tax=Arctopsyche grandis TaxID=121162 RepID=UPI00406D93EB